MTLRYRRMARQLATEFIIRGTTAAGGVRDINRLEVLPIIRGGRMRVTLFRRRRSARSCNNAWPAAAYRLH
jgi:hypothetical protein